MQRTRIGTTAIGTIALIAGSAIPALASDDDQAMIEEIVGAIALSAGEPVAPSASADDEAAVEYHDWTLETLHEPQVAGLQPTVGTTDTFEVSGPDGTFVFTVRQAEQAIDEPVSLRAFGDLAVLHRQAERERDLARITTE